MLQQRVDGLAKRRIFSCRGVRSVGRACGARRYSTRSRQYFGPEKGRAIAPRENHWEVLKPGDNRTRTLGEAGTGIHLVRSPSRLEEPRSAPPVPCRLPGPYSPSLPPANGINRRSTSEDGTCMRGKRIVQGQDALFCSYPTNVLHYHNCITTRRTTMLPFV